MNFKKKLTNSEFSCKQGLCISVLLAFTVSMVVFIPFILVDKGYFLFLGDFNVQQIPFYQLAHKCVKTGNIFWNWNTELGANFIGSYSYYMLTSPFFLLTLPFPNWMVPYLMGPLLILKHTVAVIFSYLYIKRFVKDYRFAILGSLLYAFSGFIVSNIFFNQFHEAIIFFPLLLIALEEYLVNDRKILFCLAVFINCFINYWMFIGQVIFLIVYFLCRITDSNLKITFTKFLGILLEGFIGVILAGFILCPSLLAIADNTRVGSSNLLSGWGLLLYNDSHRIPAILQSMFFPPELPSKPTFLPYHTAKWSSMAAWLPFVGMVGVISYMATRRKTWIKTILVICGIMAMFPFLNSLFTLCNINYYCRWFYMPVLIMCVATVIALENKKVKLIVGAKWSLLIVFLFLLPGFMDLVYDKYKFYTDSAIAIISIIGLSFIAIKFRASRIFPVLLIICTCFISAVYSSLFIYYGKQLSNNVSTDNNTTFMREHIINAGKNVVLPDDEFYRIDTYKDIDNIGMFWNRPAMQGFHSIVPGSLQKFYLELGIRRDVASRLSPSIYELRSLFSSKYLFVRNGKKTTQQICESVPGAKRYGAQNGFQIYENKNFIPFGFCYDNCIGDFVFKTLSNEQKRKVLIRYMYLSDEDIKKYEDILPEAIEVFIDTLDYDNYLNDVEDRRYNVVKNLKIDNRGFCGEIDLPCDNLVFFSVPFENGWSATVNGNPVEIVKANVGFMAVKCDEGHNEIRFNYFTPGLNFGGLISGIGLSLFVIYFIIIKQIEKRKIRKK